MHYFDNAATTFPKPENVYTQMDSFYRNYGVNVGRGQFKEASIAHKMVEDTKELLLNLFHCNSANKQVVFTSSATEALNLVLRGIELHSGDVVYTTPFEHNAVIRTLHMLEKQTGIVIKYLEPDICTLQYNFDDIKEQFSLCAPKMVIVNHASNVLGYISPIKEIFGLAKQHNAITVADCSQTAGLIDNNIILNHCDFAVFAGHKTLYGPFGIGGVIAPLNCNLTPLIFGGTGVESANPEMPKEEPIRYEAGSPNIQAIAGLNAALKWISEETIEVVREKEKANTAKLIEIISKFNNIKMVGSSCDVDRVGIISCVFDGYSSDSIGQVLSNFDIAVRTGLHCAPQAHKFMSTFPSGTVRFSVNAFTTDDNFLHLENALKYIEENS